VEVSRSTFEVRGLWVRDLAATRNGSLSRPHPVMQGALGAFPGGGGAPLPFLARKSHSSARQGPRGVELEVNVVALMDCHQSSPSSGVGYPGQKVLRCRNIPRQPEEVLRLHGAPLRPIRGGRSPPRSDAELPKLVEQPHGPPVESQDEGQPPGSEQFRWRRHTGSSQMIVKNRSTPRKACR